MEMKRQCLIFSIKVSNADQQAAGEQKLEKIVSKLNVWAKMIKILVTIERRDRKGERTVTFF